MIRPSALGDVCRTVPVVVRLRRAYPGAAVDWIVQDSFVEAASGHPDVRRVIAFPRRRFGGWWKPAVLGEMLGWLGALRRERYDMVLDCQGLARSGVFARWSGAPARIGYQQAEEGAWLALTRRVDAPMGLHTVDRMLRLADAATGASEARPATTDELRLYAPAGSRDALRGLLGGGGAVLDGRYAVVAPTSRWAGKVWPGERYAEAVTTLLSDRGHGVEGAVIVGAEQERGQCGELLRLAERGELNVIDAIGRTSVGALMALVERAGLVIGSDSACVHMAVGFDRPLVALYGPTDVARVGPYGRAASVIQKLKPGDRFDHKDEALGRAMMERIGVEDVLAKVDEVLSASGSLAAGTVDGPKGAGGATARAAKEGAC
ncbi:MAG: glycosyltransferase family 9 protein [Phycisphaerales bacterium]